MEKTCKGILRNFTQILKGNFWERFDDTNVSPLFKDFGANVGKFSTFAAVTARHSPLNPGKSGRQPFTKKVQITKTHWISPHLDKNRKKWEKRSTALMQLCAPACIDRRRGRGYNVDRRAERRPPERGRSCRDLKNAEGYARCRKTGVLVLWAGMSAI